MSKEANPGNDDDSGVEKPDLDDIAHRVLKKIESEPPDSLENIPEEQRVEIVKGVIEKLMNDGGAEISFRHFFSGPMPPPDMLAKYNKVHPDFANSLLTDFIEQGRHRRTLEGMAISGQLKESRLGQIFAFILSVIIIGVGGLLIFYNGSVGLGLGLIAGNIVTLVGLHLRGKSKQSVDLEEKA